MSVGGLILVICLYPFVFLMYFLLKNDGLSKKNGRFGVSLKKEQQKAPEVEQIVAEYSKQMRRILVILLVVPLPLIFIPWFSIMTSLWMIWMLATCFVFFVPYGIANEKLKALKLEKGWKEKQEQPVYVEMKGAGSLRCVKWYQFLPQCVIGAICLGIAIVNYQSTGHTMLPILVGSFAVVPFLFWGAAVWMDTQKTQIISMDSDVNVNYGRAKKNLWKNLWVACSWVSVVYAISLFWSLDADGRLTIVFWVGFLLYTLLTVLLLWGLLKKKNALDERYCDKMDMALVDDDDNWIWGMIYYNPKDRHSMVEKRVGAGTTMNMATPAGKAFGMIMGGSLLFLPVLCIYLIFLEFTPIQLSIKDNQLVAAQMREEYVIWLHSIDEVELLTELPKMSRNHGTNIAGLKKGSYRISGEGSSEVFLNPQNSVFLKIEALGDTYYFSGCDDEETLTVYEELK